LDFLKDPYPISAPASADLKFAPGEGNFNWDSFEALKSTDLAGEEVTVFGPWLGPDQELVESVLAYFAEATGADVKYTGSDSFEQQIVIDTEAGSAPNIALKITPRVNLGLIWAPTPMPTALMNCSVFSIKSM